MICHLLATHELTLDNARRTVWRGSAGGPGANIGARGPGA